MQEAAPSSSRSSPTSSSTTRLDVTQGHVLLCVTKGGTRASGSRTMHDTSPEAIWSNILYGIKLRVVVGLLALPKAVLQSSNGLLRALHRNSSNMLSHSTRNSRRLRKPPVVGRIALGKRAVIDSAFRKERVFLYQNSPIWYNTKWEILYLNHCSSTSRGGFNEVTSSCSRVRGSDSSRVCRTAGMLPMRGAQGSGPVSSGAYACPAGRGLRRTSPHGSCCGRVLLPRWLRLFRMRFPGGALQRLSGLLVRRRLHPLQGRRRFRPFP